MSIFFAKDDTELLKRFLQNCNPTITRVNSKSLIITWKFLDLVEEIPTSRKYQFSDIFGGPFFSEI